MYTPFCFGTIRSRSYMYFSLIRVSRDEMRLGFLHWLHRTIIYLSSTISLGLLMHENSTTTFPDSKHWYDQKRVFQVLRWLILSPEMLPNGCTSWKPFLRKSKLRFSGEGVARTKTTVRRLSSGLVTFDDHSKDACRTQLWTDLTSQKTWRKETNVKEKRKKAL